MKSFEQKWAEVQAEKAGLEQRISAYLSDLGQQALRISGLEIELRRTTNCLPDAPTHGTQACSPCGKCNACLTQRIAALIQRVDAIKGEHPQEEIAARHRRMQERG